MDIDVSQAQPTEATLQAIADFYRRVWPDETEGREEKVRWAFAGNPLGRAPLLVATEEADRVLAVRSGIPWNVNMGDGSPQRLIQLHGTAVDASIRRQGVFSRMTDEFLEQAGAEGVPLIFNVSVAASRAGYERLGWTYVDSLRSMFLPVRPDRFARQIARRPPRARPRSQQAHSSRPGFSTVEHLLQARERSLAGMMHTAYTADFLDWRFDPAAHRWLGDPDGGYVVYRLRPRGNLNEMLIGDVWPGTSSAGRLLRRAIRHERPDLVTSWTTVDHPLYRDLRRTGFLVQPGRSLDLGLRRPDGETPNVTCALMAADIDTF